MADWDRPFPMRYKDQPSELVTLRTLGAWAKKKRAEEKEQLEKEQLEKLKSEKEQQKSSVPPKKPQNTNK